MALERFREILQHTFYNNVSSTQLLKSLQSSNMLRYVGTKQWSTSLMGIKLRRQPHWPWHWPATHSHNSRYPHRPLDLQQSYTHCTQRPRTIRSCSPAGVCYIDPPTLTSNTLCNIQTDTALTSLPGPPTQMADTGMRAGVCSSKPLAHQWQEYSNDSTGPCSPEAGAYYTRELLFSPSMAMKSHPAYYTWVRIVCDILTMRRWWLTFTWGGQLTTPQLTYCYPCWRQSRGGWGIQSHLSACLHLLFTFTDETAQDISTNVGTKLLLGDCYISIHCDGQTSKSQNQKQNHWHRDRKLAFTSSVVNTTDEERDQQVEAVAVCWQHETDDGRRVSVVGMSVH